MSRARQVFSPLSLDSRHAMGTLLPGVRANPFFRGRQVNVYAGNWTFPKQSTNGSSAERCFNNNNKNNNNKDLLFQLNSVQTRSSNNTICKLSKTKTSISLSLLFYFFSFSLNICSKFKFLIDNKKKKEKKNRIYFSK